MPAGRPKGSGGINKSKMIREYLESNPSATTSEIMEALGAKGIDVSQALIAGVRARDSKGPGSKTRSKGAITAGELTAVTSMIERFEDESIILGVISDISTLVDEMGSFDRFKESIEAYKTSDSDSATITDESTEDSEEDSDEDSSSYDDEEDDD
jgi:hypothetical protein